MFTYVARAADRLSFTVRNVNAGHRDSAGDMVLRGLGDVTVHLEPMTSAELDEWLDVLDETMHVPALQGWNVTHPEAGHLGLLFQVPGGRVHVEWYDPSEGDHFAAGSALQLRHGAAYIVDTRQRAGHGVPVDAVPAPVPVKAPERPQVLADGTRVRYHGSLQQLHGDDFTVEECECFDCDLYQLVPVGGWEPVAQHVGLTSVTALEVQRAA